MSNETKIEWCDSTINPVMGCSGCELWNEERKTCYAGHKRRKGQCAKAIIAVTVQECPCSPSLSRSRNASSNARRPLFGRSCGDRTTHRIDKTCPVLPRCSSMNVNRLSLMSVRCRRCLTTPTKIASIDRLSLFYLCDFDDRTRAARVTHTHTIATHGVIVRRRPFLVEPCARK